MVSLHKFLFGDENYTPSDMVKKISAKIASDTGLYKEGKPVGDVGTDGGYIPKTTEAKKKTRQQRTAQKAVLLLKRTMKVLLPQKRVLLTVKLILSMKQMKMEM